MAVELNYDMTFEAQFGDDAANTIRRIATHASNMYTWSSLDTQLNWQVCR
jgi:hypothetical protein